MNLFYKILYRLDVLLMVAAIIGLIIVNFLL